MSSRNFQWSATGYREAAEKHFITCENLVRLASSESGKHRSCIVSDIFYIGGYVIECSLKFLFLVNQSDKNKQYSSDELNNLGLWNHDLCRLYRLAQSAEASTLPYSYNGFKDRTKKWSEQVRYDCALPRTEHDSVLVNFWDDVTNVYNSMRENY